MTIPVVAYRYETGGKGISRKFQHNRAKQKGQIKKKEDIK